MDCPPEIIDSLESIIEIYFSGIRHKERAAFILCDNLVEMSCKTRALQHNHKFDTTCNFYNAWNAPGVQLPTSTLGGRVQGYRNARNNMQHANAAATVDSQYCANAILDAVKVINYCWQNTSESQFPLWMKCALRIIQLYSPGGNREHIYNFEKKMREMRWRSAEKESVKFNAIQIEPGLRDYWYLIIRRQTLLIEECLNEIQIP